MKSRRQIPLDFIIKSDPLTDEDRKAISAFIKKDKAKRMSKNSAKQPKKSKIKAILA